MAEVFFKSIFNSSLFLDFQEETMKKIRDIMTRGAECIGEDETVLEAAKRMAQLDVGALPICSEGNQLTGMLTDRDIVVKVLAKGKDPSSTTAVELEQGEAVTVDADDSVDQALQAMTKHKVRRLPVVEGGRLVGMVSQGDVAVNIENPKVGDLVEAISAAP
jgi:CBS domain-containing protein